MKAIIYHNPKCSKSRAALEYLKRHNIDADIKLYITNGITRAEILEITYLLSCYVINILRVKEKIFNDNYVLKDELLSKEGLISALVTHPILLERPIILFKEKDIGAICRSEASLHSLLKYVGIDVDNNDKESEPVS